MLHSKKEEFVTMQTKLGKFAALALLATIGLTSCSNDIVAKPDNYEDDLVTIEGYDEEIYNNVTSIVYDALHDGTLPSEVLDKVLYEFAISIVGNYNTLTSDIEGVTLKEAAASAEGSDKTKANEFVKAHKAYWTLDSDGKRVGGEDADASESELARVVAKWEAIEERIAKKMHKEISSGSYSDRNIFSEEDYLMTLHSGLNKVANPLVASEVSKGLYEGLITPNVEDIDVFKGTSPILHREYYQSSIVSEENAANTYVEDEIIPGIYRELLVEQYLLDETYNTLGRSYARKVNVVSITANSEYPLAANYLVNEFVDSYINGGKEVNLNTFKLLSNAWKGVNLTTEEAKLLADAGLTKATSGNYYLGTAYGDLMEDYEKITDNPLTTDTAIESSFTNNNAYPKEVGLQIKTNEILLKDYTENGWYIKNGGLTNLPEDIRTRLFNIGVANALDGKGSDALPDRKDNGYAKYADEDSYIARINGKNYLKVSETEDSTSNKDMLFYDKTSSTYYIIQIEEAASSSKLSKTSDNSYAELRDDETMETIVNEVARVVADNDSFKTLSTKHWLEKAALQYHDQKVYDYFLDNYPDLFE